MDMVGYIFMGEYSTACVCRLREARGARAGIANEDIMTLASSEVAGVMTQMRRAQEREAAR